MSSKKKRKNPCSFESLKKPLKSKAFEFIRYIVQADRKLKTKAKTNWQTRTHKSLACKKVSRNQFLAGFVTRMLLCWRTFRQAPGLVHLESWIVSCENKHCPSRNSSKNLLTNFVVRAAEFKSCKGYFPPGATFEPAL